MHQLSAMTRSFLPHLGCEINVTILPGELRVLCGENGIGKSTLLRNFFDKYKNQKCIILGDQKPLEFFFDRSLAIYKKILFSGNTNGNKTLFDKYWKASGFEEKEGRLLSQLSGGESQLLKLITLCSAGGEIYFLDEPGQYLDREKRKLANELLEELKSSGKSILVIEHDYSWFSSGTVVSELFIQDETLKERKSWTI
ncbi:MAG: ABC transporter ATP-binding protein [Bdellovibrionota bacterium]